MDRLRLQIRLTIEILGLNKKTTLLVHTVEHNHISREELILHDLDDHCRLDVLPLLPLVLLFRDVIDLDLVLVLFLVRLVPLIVFKSILEHGYEDDHAEGEGHHRFAARYRYRFYRLHVGDQQEVKI